MHEVRSGNFLWRGSESCVPQQTSVNGLESHGGRDGLVQPRAGITKDGRATLSQCLAEDLQLERDAKGWSIHQ